MANSNEIDFNDPAQVAVIDLKLFCNLVNFKDILESYKTEFDDINGIIIKLVSCIGGSGSSDGERVEWIYQVKNSIHEVLCHIKFTGYYGSYSGIDWDNDDGDPQYVYPQKVLMTKYTLNRTPIENETYYGE